MLAYNKQLAEGFMPTQEMYNTVLNPSGNGIMGSLEIPSINIDLPIWHGCTDTVISKVVGHIEQTALPIGGQGTHAVLTSHTGLPSAKLFTDLHKVKIGERFYITVLNQCLT
ncbi:sortase, partial [Eubacterium aggregans]